VQSEKSIIVNESVIKRCDIKSVNESATSKQFKYFKKIFYFEDAQKVYGVYLPKKFIGYTFTTISHSWTSFLQSTKVAKGNKANHSCKNIP